VGQQAVVQVLVLAVVLVAQALLAVQA